MSINRLVSGGIITNYQCQAACGHCMYGCAPNAEPGYITEDMAQTLCDILRRLGCTQVHIGGGEPFIRPEGLIQLIRVIHENKCSLDYIETNAAWVSGDRKRDQGILQAVQQAGADCIMVSCDPFHIAFIPFWKTAYLVNLLEEMYISYFIWQQRYWSVLSRLNPQITYTREALQAALGYDAAGKSVKEYGMGFNGRALNLLRETAPKKPAEYFITAKPCDALQRISHFHVDFLGRYIPPGCTGMGICITDLAKPLSREKYPVMERLFTGGLACLLDYAQTQGCTLSSEGYVSPCDVCFSLRKQLAHTAPERHPDITPLRFYQQDF